jgi:hypothetical protein
VNDHAQRHVDEIPMLLETENVSLKIVAVGMVIFVFVVRVWNMDLRNVVGGKGDLEVNGLVFEEKNPHPLVLLDGVVKDIDLWSDCGSVVVWNILYRRVNAVVALLLCLGRHDCHLVYNFGLGLPPSGYLGKKTAVPIFKSPLKCFDLNNSR